VDFLVIDLVRVADFERVGLAADRPLLVGVADDVEFLGHLASLEAHGVALAVAGVILVYNLLVKRRQLVNSGWSDIDVQLKRRYNLIPNLVETVKGYAKHEEGVFTKVTQARASAMKAESAQEQAKAENILKDTLKSLFAVAENYPELKANQNFLQLQNDLKDTEDKIEAARRFYNGNVRDFNTMIQKFPNNVIATQLGFTEFTYFALESEKERAVPQVDFKGKGAATKEQGVQKAQTPPPAEPKPQQEAQKTPETKPEQQQAPKQAPAAEEKKEATPTEKPQQTPPPAEQESKPGDEKPAGDEVKKQD